MVKTGRNQANGTIWNEAIFQLARKWFRNHFNSIYLAVNFRFCQACFSHCTRFLIGILIDGLHQMKVHLRHSLGCRSVFLIGNHFWWLQNSHQTLPPITLMFRISFLNLSVWKMAWNAWEKPTLTRFSHKKNSICMLFPQQLAINLSLGKYNNVLQLNNDIINSILFRAITRILFSLVHIFGTMRNHFAAIPTKYILCRQFSFELKITPKCIQCLGLEHISSGSNYQRRIANNWSRFSSYRFVLFTILLAFYLHFRCMASTEMEQKRPPDSHHPLPPNDQPLQPQSQLGGKLAARFPFSVGRIFRGNSKRHNVAAVCSSVSACVSLIMND